MIFKIKYFFIPNQRALTDKVTKVGDIEKGVIWGYPFYLYIVYELENVVDKQFLQDKFYESKTRQGRHFWKLIFQKNILFLDLDELRFFGRFFIMRVCIS